MIRNRALWFVVVILLIWNVILSFILYDRNSKDVYDKDGVKTTIIENEINGFSSDLTNIYEKIRSAIVTVEGDSKVGTGVIVKQDGNDVYVVTNYHLIEDLPSVYLSLDNYQRIACDLVGQDIIRDVAVLRFESAYDVSPITIGDSELLKAGEFVVAVGSPLSSDYRGSLSFGIVSSSKRTLDLTVDDRSYFISMIQSDVTLNSGNSGGPLVNMAGELVGINTLSVSVSDAQGLSFALPSHELIHIIDTIIEGNDVIKRDLGLKVTEISSMTNYQKAATNIDLDLVHGLLVNEVKSGFIGESLGLRGGDIILMINDKEITTIEDMIDEEYKISDTMSVAVRRGEENVVLEMDFE